MNILITGGEGFIGLNLINKLYDTDFNITSLDYYKTDKFSERVEKIEADIGMFNDIVDIFSDKDIVIHLAGVKNLENDPGISFVSNTIGTLNCLTASAQNNIKRFIYASSGSVYGNNNVPFNEEMLPEPITPYDASKLSGENYCKSFYYFYNLKTICLRFSNVYGPFSDLKDDFIPNYIKSMKDENIFSLNGDGTQTRDFIYVDDVIDAILFFAFNDKNLWGQEFNIGSGEERSLNQVVDILNKFSNDYNRLSIPTINRNEFENQIYKYCLDISKFKNLFSDFPRTSFEDGLKCTIDYFLKEN